MRYLEGQRPVTCGLPDINVLSIFPIMYMEWEDQGHQTLLKLFV